MGEQSHEDLAERQVTLQRALTGAKQEKERLKVPISDVKQRIAVLSEELKQYQLRDYKLLHDIEDIEYQLAEVQYEQQAQQRAISGLKFDIMLVTDLDLPTMPMTLIQLVVKKRYGVDRYVFYDNMSETPREFPLDDRKYRDAIIRQLSHYSCKFCHSVYHVIKDCPTLAKKKCTACGQQGHDMYHCKERLIDVYRRKYAKKSYPRK